MLLGTTMLGRRHVLPAVCSTLRELQVEGTFPMGTFLVTVHNPISTDDGDLARALYGSFLPVPDNETVFPLPPASEYQPEQQPGAVVVVKGTVALNQTPKRARRRLRVTSTGDRPIQVGSHYHFIEVNPQLEFDRERAYGFRLDIPAGTSVRFEPGDTKTVRLVAIGGRRIIRGGNNVASGPVDMGLIKEIVSKMQAKGYAHMKALDEGDGNDDIFLVDPRGDGAHMDMVQMDRAAYATMFGPTTGDLVRLSNTNLWIQVERDMTSYGDECKFGGGKTLRDGMGQASGRRDADTLDVVVTNALIVDWTGIYKADIGIKDGMIVGIGKAGNPDVMDGVAPNMVVGSCTDVVAAEGKIVTAGGIDTHVHFICPQQVDEALASGITTMIGGGTGPRCVLCVLPSRVHDVVYTYVTYCIVNSSSMHMRDLHIYVHAYASETIAVLHNANNLAAPAPKRRPARPARDISASCCRPAIPFRSTSGSQVKAAMHHQSPSANKSQPGRADSKSTRTGAQHQQPLMPV